jgi:pimeloyl-ACP methyl ester carboxylesterase
MHNAPGLTRVLVAIVAAVLLFAGPADAQVQGPGLGPCADVPESLNARCGSIAVPLDRANPSLGMTEVAFAVLRRRDESRPSLGTIVGPAGAGVPVIGLAPRVAPIFGGLLNRRELLLVDPRGVGRSDPVECRSLSEVAYGLTPAGRMTAAVGACGRELGPRAASYGNAAIADDLEAVRAVLGIEQLDLWGSSYGTYLMTVYAARHPERVRSIVLDSAYPIAYDPWGLDKLAGSRDALRHVCARTHACRGRGVLRDIARLAARLRREPVRFTARAGERRFRLSLDDGALATVVYGGGNPLFLGRLPGAVRSGLAGDLAPLRRLVETPALGNAAVLAGPEASGLAGEAAFLAGACHDFPRAFSYADAPEARRAAYEQALAAVGLPAFAPFSPKGWLDAGFERPDWCLEWPNDPTAVLPLPSGSQLPDLPVLALTGDLDANTPTSAGRAAAAQYPRSTFVEVPNAGHEAASTTPCAAALARRFVRTLTADPGACEGTGAPPPVAGRAPLRAAQLALVRADATRPQRRALGLVVATVADMQEQAAVYEPWGSARALRGGRYRLRRDGSLRLSAVRVVRDARVSGALASGRTGIVSGTVRLAGSGVPPGRLRVRLSPTGRGRASGMLDGQRTDIRFQSP